MYKTGELAKMLGLTNEGVRYMEKKGIIHAQRDEKNGYREYDRGAYVRLRRAKYMCTIGFSLDEARRLLDGDVSQEDAGRMYVTKLQELEERKRELRLIEKELLLQKNALEMEEAGEAAFHFYRAEDMVFFQRAINDKGIAFSSEDRAAADLWTKTVPREHLISARYASGKTVKGTVMSAEDFNEQNLPWTDNTLLIKPGLCARGAITAEKGVIPDTRAIFRWIEAQGRRATGDVYFIVRVMVRGNSDNAVCIHEFFAPVRDKNEEKILDCQAT